MKSNIQTAQWYLNHFLAGIIMCEPNQEGQIEWVGEDKNWTMLGWLQDGVYDDWSKEDRDGIIRKYLTA